MIKTLDQASQVKFSTHGKAIDLLNVVMHRVTKWFFDVVLLLVTLFLHNVTKNK